MQHHTALYIAINTNMKHMDSSTQALIKQLRSSEKPAPDFVIRCRGHVFPAHKLLLALRSEYFEKLFSSRGSFLENEHNTIELRDEYSEPRVVRVLLKPHRYSFPMLTPSYQAILDII